MKLNQNLTPDQKQTYRNIAFCAGGVVILAISIVFFFLNFGVFSSFFKKALGICYPLIYGACIAYALNPLMKFSEKKLLYRRKTDPKFSCQFRRTFAIFLSFLFLVSLLVLFFAMIIPQLRVSLSDLVDKFPEYTIQLEEFAESLASKNETFAGLVNSARTYIENTMNNLDDLIQDYLPMLEDILHSFAALIFDLVLGFIFAGYFLYNKEHIIAQVQKISKSFLSESNYDKVRNFLSVVDKTFGKYFVAAILDSILVGFICFLLVQLAGMPYAPLIGVVIAITNIIPIFGPFIGAIPCAVILFVCKPSYALIFAVMILVVQQIDGNIIVPRIHGASTGLPPVWIIVSITIMSGLFGFVGMFIGVPCFSIIYMLVKQTIEKRLEEKALPTQTVDYMSAEEKRIFDSQDTASSEKTPRQKKMRDRFKKKTFHHGKNDPERTEDQADADSSAAKKFSLKEMFSKFWNWLKSLKIFKRSKKDKNRK
ncbi:MAG: AI-2E family transporter [Clostridia bacterium]|nr:AI-2E family transporter [Clostridia bacterium]